MRSLPYTVVVFSVLGLSLAAQAQNNFYNGGGVALYNPIVDTVTSGTQLVVSPTVSADRKYVTLSTVVQVSQVVKIQNFPFFGINNAFAGGAGLPPSDNNATPPTTRPYWDRQKAGLLQRPGMTFVGAP
ncbi:MAG: hypothetical protein ABSH20_15255 [Tepidisphaeraceae bacterium]|jgi:hypothetical protein